MVVIRPSSRAVEGEVPSGTIDGANLTFGTIYAYRSGSTKLYLNGVRQRAGGNDYAESGSTIVFTLAPRVGDTILIDYLKG